MRKSIYLLLSILIFTIYGIHVGVVKQQNDYKTRIDMYLAAACNHLIQMDFGEHVSDIDIEKSDKNIFAGSTIIFDGKNNVSYINVEGSAFVYFNDMAPQEITCSASMSPLPAEKYKISDETKIIFSFIGPSYIPSTFVSRYRNSKLVLKIRQIDNMFDLGFVNIKNKPAYQFYGLF